MSMRVDYELTGSKKRSHVLAQDSSGQLMSAM